jgi:serine/threonine-protein kinase
MGVPFGRYQLLRKIASGGMGQIFLARTEGTQGFEKLIVIKRLLPHLAEDEEFREMFFEEARIAARLNHPNLIQIFDLGQEGSSCYLAMEYVPGHDLRHLEWHARSLGRPIPLGIACRIIADAAAGLDCAHQAVNGRGQSLGLVHRDVSPQNVLIGFDGAVKLIDFGVVKALDQMQHTITGILKGKYPYMSPEQASGEEVDHRSDIFSLGIIFWELLARARLFKGSTDMSTIRLVRECEVRPPSSVNPEITPELDALAMRALARDRQARYPDAAAFRMAIEEFILLKQLQASAVHVVAYLSGLYGDRVPSELDLAGSDRLMSLEELETGSSSPGKDAPLGGEGNGSYERHGRDRQRTVRLALRPRRVRNRWKSLAMAAMLAVIGLLAVQLIKLRGGPRPTPSARSDGNQPAARPSTVTSRSAITLASKPSGASVEMNGKKLGFTPLTLDLEGVQTAVFTHPGFEPLEVALSSEDGPLFTAELIRKRTPKAKRTTHLGIKTGR